VPDHSLRIFYDSLQEANWFQRLSPKLNSAAKVKLGERGANPPEIESLLRYDRPDIVVSVDGKPKLVIEKTSEVPTGHNVTQRFGRLANAVEEDIMIVYMLPFKARKHGKYASNCFISARLFMALRRMQEIHGVPCLAVEWPSDQRLELIRDGSEDSEMRALVDELISGHFEYDGLKSVARIQEEMESARTERARAEPETAEPPRSVEIVETSSIVSELNRLAGASHDELPGGFESRRRTLVYTMEMTPEKCRREDPYTGTQFLYDYIWCRNGKMPQNKHTNLVLSVPKVSRARWLEANPNDPFRKSALWYATANLIRVKNGVIPCESLVGPNRMRSANLER
jgi:hypothetical protein